MIDSPYEGPEEGGHNRYALIQPSAVWSLGSLFQALRSRSPDCVKGSG